MNHKKRKINYLINNISELPNDILKEIISYLGFEELFNIRVINKNFRNLSSKFWIQEIISENVDIYLKNCFKFGFIIEKLSITNSDILYPNKIYPIIKNLPESINYLNLKSFCFEDKLFYNLNPYIKELYANFKIRLPETVKNIPKSLEKISNFILDYKYIFEDYEYIDSLNFIFIYYKDFKNKNIKINGKKLIIYSCIGKNYDMLNYFLQYETNINFLYKNLTLLSYACIYKNDNNFIKFLIKKGALINIFVLNKITLLSYLCFKNYYETTKILLENGANPNFQNDLGMTSLMYSSQFYSIEFVKLLINFGANINLQNNKGNTALIIYIKYIATFENDLFNIKKSVTQKISEIKPQEFIPLLKNSLYIKNNKGKTALQIAIKYKMDNNIIDLLN